MRREPRKLAIVPPAPSPRSGSIRGMGGSFAAAEFTGAATMTMPLPLPDARGSQPALELAYSSSAGNGPFGVGFDVATGSVARSTTRSMPRYEPDDVFEHTAFGELVYVAGADRNAQNGDRTFVVRTYRPRREGEFPRVEWWTSPTGSFWLSVDRNNVTSVFGADVTARVADPSDASREFQWLLQETFDPRGNHVLYEYKTEDGAGVHGISERGRAVGARKYVAAVRYGNAAPLEQSIVLTSSAEEVAALEWHFHVVFDYGEYSEDSRPAGTPVGEWTVRPDAFSSWRAGFELRTYRLCRSILVLHQFPSELGPDPLLVRALRFRYDESPFMSTLARVEEVGFRNDPADPQSPPLVQALPPTELSWSSLDPTEGAYRELDYSVGGIPEALPEDDLRWVDLYGVGIPGLLHASDGGVRFWEPVGIDEASASVTYSGPQTVAAVPLGAAEGAPSYVLGDAIGAGRPQWLSVAPGIAGYAEIDAAGDSGPLRLFPAFPTDYSDPLREQVGVTGTGLPDLLLMGAGRVEYNPSLGSGGYGPAQETPSAAPPVTRDLPGEALRFDDVLASGTQHYVRVRNGSVTCWPNLGFGRFGDPIELADAPYFEEDFDPQRLFLADLDGSGATDIVYRYARNLRVWRNRSGNGFAAPFDIPLPPGADAAARIEFADVLGIGVSCLVVMQPVPAVRHWAFVFGTGEKPYLLTGIDNGTGRRTTVDYTTSARQYVTDRLEGIEWLTAPPSPVHVVASVTDDDLLSSTTSTQSFRYRHGYYDPEECTFTGFGFVERVDAPTIDDDSAPPPLVVRTWFHTGAAPGGASLEALYRAEYFSGDQSAYDLPESIAALQASGGEAMSAALWSLVGRPLCEETYGWDASQAASSPYTVARYRYLMTQLQVATEDAPSVVFTRPLESIAFDYERNAADPRVQHAFTLGVDQYGNVLETCDVHYARRRSAPGGVPLQYQPLVSRTTSSYLDVTQPFHLLGVLDEEVEEQVLGLAIPPGGYITYDEVVRQLGAIGSGAPGAPTAVTTHRARYSYVPDPHGAALAPQRLPRSIAEAEHDRAALEQAFDGVLDAGELETVLADTGAGGCGLQAGSGSDAAWWWNPGDTLSYAGSDGFYRPRTSTDAFGNSATAVDDPYSLFVATVVDAHGNTTTGVADYQALQYASITDPNGGVAERGFDPLGFVQVTSYHGSEGGQPVGFASLDTWDVPPTQPSIADVVADPATFLQDAATAFVYDVCAWTGSTAPAAFERVGVDVSRLWADLVARGYVTKEGAVCRRLRDARAAGTFALSAPFAGVASEVEAILWAAPGGSPIAGLHIAATAGPGAASSSIVQRIAYYDGWLRPLQAKLKTGESEGAESWLTSGAVRYDTKGQVVREFEPFFSPVATFDPVEVATGAGVSSAFSYDAPGRLVRTDTPLGTFRETVYGSTSSDGTPQASPWTVTAYDENDTLLQSRYYAEVMGAEDPDPWEEQTVARAALCSGSPTSSLLDAMGRVVRVVRQNDAVVTVSDLEAGGYDAATAARLLTDLTGAGYLDSRGVFTPSFQPFRPLWHVTLPSPFDVDEVAITALLARLQSEGTPLTTDVVPDAHGNPAQVTDSRLASAGCVNLTTFWSLTDRDVHSSSADAGESWRLFNAYGNVVWERDANGTVTTTGYDALQRAASQRVTRTDGTAVQTVIGVYGDTPRPGDAGPYFTEANVWNLRGQLVVALDQSGIALCPFASILGHPYAHSRTIRSDPTAVPDWSGVDDDALATLCASLTALKDPAGLPTVPLPPEIQSLVETTPYVDQAGYDALGRIVRLVDADGNVTSCTLDLRGLVAGVDFVPSSAGAAAASLGPIYHDAHDRPQSLLVPEVLLAEYVYHPLTFQLIGLRAVALGETGADPVRQALTYYRDPVGNVTFVLDDLVYPWPAPADPAAAYQYDLLYRLVAAWGREAGDAGPVTYQETYAYDASGNLTSATHAGAATWVRDFAIAPDSNRLASGLTYDAAGSVTAYAGGALTWTDAHQVASLTTVPAADGTFRREHNVYDARGRRVRRVTETFGTPTQTDPTEVEEVTYAGALEIVKQTSAAGDVSEWHATAIEAGALALARWIAWQEGAPPGAALHEMRFPLVDGVGSVTGELDATGEAATHVEYLPYGGDALTWAASPLDADLQRRRYGGKELDGSVLYAYGARHYSPELMRWMSPDPAGPADSLNLYEFVGGNPATFSDTNGRMKIYHWNVKDKNTVTISGPSFVNELAALLSGASIRDNEGTVVVLTEIMDSVTHVHFGNLIAALNKKAGPGWTGRAFFAGWSEGGSRREKIGILTYNVTVENYWQMVKDSPYTTQSVLERIPPGAAFTKVHKYTSRFPVGVRITTQLGGSSTSIDIGGYHNQGPSSGADVRAGDTISQARRLGVNLLIGDINTEPPRKVRRTGPNTRGARLLEGTTESTVGTSKGGSLYDRAILTNDDVNGRQLKLKNDTGSRGKSSDHASNSTILTTRRKRSFDEI